MKKSFAKLSNKQKRVYFFSNADELTITNKVKSALLKRKTEFLMFLDYVTDLFQPPGKHRMTRKWFTEAS